MRLSVPWGWIGGRAAARLAALTCVLGLAALVAWPAPAVGQEGGEEASPGGIYSVTIGRADLPPGLAGAPALIGQWILTLNDDGSYEVARQDVGVVASGAYEISGRTLTFADWSGIVCGGGGVDADDEESGASYAWESAGDNLTLTPIQETCGERRILLTTRPFGSYAACTTEPLTLQAAAPGAPGPAGTPVSEVPFDPNNPVGPPAAATPVAAPADGEPASDEVEAAIAALLREASGCWATQDPARFLPLHSQAVVAGLLAPVPGVPQEAFLDQIRSFMTTPVSFALIGDVTLTEPTRATAYVELTFNGQPFPESFDFVQENGEWLFADVFFLAPVEAPPTPEP